MTKQQAIDAITTKLKALDEASVAEIAEMIDAMDTESVLLRPLTDEELALIEQSRRDFAEGRSTR